MWPNDKSKDTGAGLRWENITSKVHTREQTWKLEIEKNESINIVN